MATHAQVLANRLNARKSTGPRTVEGKAVVAQNAVKHGLCAQRAVIVGEDLGEFEFYRDEMFGELAPAGAMESMLAERVVGLSWRLRRAERVQNEAFDALLTKDSTSPLAKLTQSLRSRSDSGGAEDDLALGRVVVKDFGNARVLDRLLMYERRIEHSLYKTMSEFHRLRLMRELEPALEEPTRAGQCWGKPQPTRATDQASPGSGCAGGDDRARQTKPIEREKCWGKPQPTCAMEKTGRAGQRGGERRPASATHQAAEAAGCPGGDGAARKTKPIARDACDCGLENGDWGFDAPS